MPKTESKFRKGRQLTIGELKTYVDEDKFVWMEIYKPIIDSTKSELTLSSENKVTSLPPELADMQSIGLFILIGGYESYIFLSP